MEKVNFKRNFCLFPFIFTGKKWPEGKIETFLVRQTFLDEARTQKKFKSFS